jgi:hypothetical protein
MTQNYQSTYRIKLTKKTLRNKTYRRNQLNSKDTLFLFKELSHKVETWNIDTKRGKINEILKN